MGGIGFIYPGHPLYNPWGWYTANRDLLFDNFEDWLIAYQRIIRKMLPQITDPLYGLSGAVYTELTDVAADVTGLATYDRQIIKIDPARVADVNRQLYTAMPT